jgi:hypothetical protein
MGNLKSLLLTMIVLAASTAMVWGQGVNAHKSAIIGSAHDLTNDTWIPSGSTTASAVGTNLCFFCHITHKTGSGIAATNPSYMMWNHTLSTVSTYGVYSSDTFNALLTNAGVALPTELGSSNNVTAPTVSNLCLSCHDGTVSIASFYAGGFGLPSTGSSISSSYGAYSQFTSGNPFLMTDLSRSHPVNFAYTPALATAAGGGLLSPGIYSVDGGGALPLYGNGAGMMECTTCHDPHNGTFAKITPVGGTKANTVFPFPRLLLGTQTGSGVCTYCHT